MLSRRRLLAALGAGTSLAWWPHWASAAAAEARLVVVQLRGGLDGLAAVPAWGEPRFAALRGSLSTGAPGAVGNTLKLDGLFGLHPSLSTLADWYRAGGLGIVHAVAPPYQGRSHFEAQNCLENGTAIPHGAHDGWLNRALLSMRGGEGLAIAAAMPLMLRGPAPASNWSPSPLDAASPDLLERLAPLYARDPALARAFERAAQSAEAMDGGGRALRLPLPAAMQSAGQMMARADGARVVLVQDDGWDTHASQARRLAVKLGSLDAGLAKLRAALGPRWQDTVVVVVTEFGRKVAINGTGGTDHGTGGVMLLAGGPVRGGVHGEWPGLAKLRDDRDLTAANDTRAVFKAVLLGHLRLPESQVERSVFPDSRAVQPIDTLLS